MGIYLNGTAAFSLYKSETRSPYFVDKTMILTELFPMIQQGNKHICITRPRRFGKTVMANMLGAFLGKGCDSSEMFDTLKISGQKGYRENLNQYNVIYIDFSEMPEECDSYLKYIRRIKKYLKEDLANAYPEAGVDRDTAVWDILNKIFLKTGDQFVFIFDEWDCIFHKDYVQAKDKAAFIDFLSNLLKGKAYVTFTYMTGILPIAKYSSGSALNMFAEFTMANSPMFSQYYGFTESEVDELFARYKDKCSSQNVTREGLRIWYNGYHTASGGQVYNPRSVVFALTFNHLANYWTSSGPYDEIFYYIEQNIDDVQKDLALMAAGEAVPAKVQEYAASSMNLSTRDEIFSAMVVYGFLSYADGKVSIPDKELMDRFSDMIRKEPSLGYVNRLAKESERMLYATLAGDVETMAYILEYAHNTETPVLSYNNEVELSAIVNLVYLAARDRYYIERENKAGKGYADFIFFPYKKTDDCIILELKAGHTPDEALRQIKERQYALRFKGKLGAPDVYTGRILGVGITYSRETKKHQCKVEVL